MLRAATSKQLGAVCFLAECSAVCFFEFSRLITEIFKKSYE